MIPTLSTGGSVLQNLGHAALVYGGRMLLQTHDAIMLNIVTLLQHVFSFDVRFFLMTAKVLVRGVHLFLTQRGTVGDTFT